MLYTNFMARETIDAYDRYADQYDVETNGFWNLFPRSTISEFVRRIPGVRVLDLGSGPGRDAEILKSHGLTVTCIDASAAMVAKTRTKGFESYQIDFRELEMPESSLDGIWCYTALLHISKVQMPDMLAKIHKWLVPSGVFGLGMIEGSSEGLTTSDSMPGVARLFALYKENELRDLLQLAGFEVVFFESIQPRTRRYLNFVCVA